MLEKMDPLLAALSVEWLDLDEAMEREVDRGRFEVVCVSWVCQ